MTFTAARNTIQNHFNTNFKTTIIKWDNVPFENPNDSAWVQFHVLNNLGRQVSTGAPTKRFRRFGIIMAQIYTPEGSGQTIAMSIADEIADIFDGLTVNEIRFWDVSVKEVGTFEGWYRVNVVADFLFDDLK